MNSKRPTTYVAWREVWRDSVHDLGMIVGFYWLRTGKVVVDRDLWYCLHRFRRLERRMEAEFDACDRTCAAEILKLIFGEEA